MFNGSKSYTYVIGGLNQASNPSSMSSPSARYPGRGGRRRTKASTEGPRRNRRETPPAARLRGPPGNDKGGRRPAPSSSVFARTGSATSDRTAPSSSSAGVAPRRNFGRGGTLGGHVVEACRKAGAKGKLIARLLPDIGGPSDIKTRMMTGVHSSIILYTAPVVESYGNTEI